MKIYTMPTTWDRHWNVSHTYYTKYLIKLSLDDIVEDNQTVFLKFSPQLAIINPRNVFDKIDRRFEKNLYIYILEGIPKGKNDKYPYAVEFPTDKWTEEDAKNWLIQNNKKYIDFQSSKFENAWRGKVYNFAYKDKSGNDAQIKDRYYKIEFDIINELISDPLKDEEIKKYIDKYNRTGWYLDKRDINKNRCPENVGW